MFVVAFNTGQSPVSKSLFAAVEEICGEHRQVFTRAQADYIVKDLNRIGSDNPLVKTPKTLAFVLPEIHPAVKINPRTGYVRINAPLFRNQFKSSSNFFKKD